MVQSTAELQENAYSDQEAITLAGIIVSKTIRLNKKNEKFAIVKIEDLRGTLEFPIYAKLYEQCKEILGDEPLFIRGRVNYRDEEVGFFSDELQLLSDFRKENAKSITIEIDHREVSEEQLRFVRGTFMKYPGNHPIHIHIRTPEGSFIRIRLAEKVGFEPALMQELEDLLKFQAFIFTY